MHKTLDLDGLRLGAALAEIFSANGRRILDGLSGHVRHRQELQEQVLEADLDADGVWKLRDLLQAHDRASASIEQLDRRLRAGLADWREPIRLLETVPGIDRGSACAILVELGPDLSAFRSAEIVAAWAGVAPGNNESAGKRRSGRVRRGNSTLAECAHGAVRTRGTQFRSYHQARVGKLGHKRSILAMLRDNEPYRDPGIDYQALVVHRNAARWLAKLEQYGYLQAIQTAAAGQAA